jgi:hypothetical protein
MIFENLFNRIFAHIKDNTINLIKRKDLNGAKNYPLMIEGAGGVDFDVSQIFLFSSTVL